MVSHLSLIGCNQKKLTGAFEPTNHRNPPVVDRRTDNFVSGSSGIAREFVPHSTVCDYYFYIIERQVILGHFLEEMRDCKFIVAISNLLSNPLDYCQAALSTTQ
jgi:hypothetical protein